MNERFHTVTELAEMFGKSRQTIHNWIDDGRFPGAFEVGEGGGKVVLVPASDIEDMKRDEAEELIKRLNRLGFQTVPA